MSFNRNKIMAIERSGTVKFPDGSVLEFVFYPNKNTPNFSDSLEAAKENGEVKNFIVGWITRLLKSWDVVDEAPQTDSAGNPIIGPDGNPVMVEVAVPITVEAVGDMSNNVLDALFQEMMALMRVGEAKGTQSRGSFV